MPSYMGMTAFGRGMAQGERTYFDTLQYQREAQADQRAAEEHDLRMKYLTLLNSQQQQANDTAQSVQNLRNTAAQRMLAGYENDPAQMQASGLSLPSQQMVEGGGTGYGAGPTAVQDMAGDYARESARMPNAAPMGATGIKTQPYTTLDKYRDLGAIATMQGRDKDAIALDQASGQIQAQQAVSQALAALADPNKRAAIYSSINTQLPNLTIVAPPTDPKTGQAVGPTGVTYVRPDGSANHIQLSDSQLKRVVAGDALMDYDYAAGLKLLSGVDKDLAAAVAANNQTAIGASKANTEAYKAQSLAKYQQGLLANDNTRTQQGARPDFMVLGATPDGKGLAVLDRRTGRMSVQVAPQGLDTNQLFPRITGARAGAPGGPTVANAIDLAKSLIGTPTGQKDDRGADVMYTPQTAYAAAQQMLAQQGGGARPPAGAALDPAVIAATKANLSGQKSAPPTAPAQGALNVRGRPFYNTDQATLEKMADKPRGVSSAEAAAARDELQKRQGESRMSAY